MFDVKKITDEQKALLDAELAKRGVKFLPAQAARRVVEPSAGLKVLGASKRAKSARSAKMAAAAKAKASPAAAAPAKK